jgi:hypothetical protein
MEEITEGEVVEAHERRVERDAAKWQILNTNGEEVTFRAGTEVFVVHKSGMIYREWEKEAKRRANGGAMYPKFEGVIITAADTAFEPIGKVQALDNEKYVSVLQIVDTQLEERQHRLNELRKRYLTLPWGTPEKDDVRDQIVTLEKKVLGDPL